MWKQAGEGEEATLLQIQKVSSAANKFLTLLQDGKRVSSRDADGNLIIWDTKVHHFSIKFI